MALSILQKVADFFQMTINNLFPMAAFTSVVLFFEKYIFNDWELLSWILIVYVLDATTGIWKGLKQEKFSSKKLTGLIEKFIIYCIVLVLYHFIKNFKIDGVHPGVMDWLATYGIVGILIKEITSIFENLEAIRPFLPEWIKTKLNDYNKTGKIEK